MKLWDPFGNFGKMDHVFENGQRVFVEHNHAYHRGKIEGPVSSQHYRIKLDSGHEVIAHHTEMTPELFPEGESTLQNRRREEIERVQKANEEFRRIVDPYGLDRPLVKVSSNTATFLKFFPLMKIDESRRMVHGVVTAEVEDRDGETCHYDSTKTEYEKVNEEMSKASDGENIMPLREMHQLQAVGAGKTIQFDDAHKQIKMAFKVVDDAAWNKVLNRVLLGFSQGGSYLRRWTEGGRQFYTARPGEISLVDRPCLAGALIEHIKADGRIETFKAEHAKYAYEALPV